MNFILNCLYYVVVIFTLISICAVIDLSRQLRLNTADNEDELKKLWINAGIENVSQWNELKVRLEYVRNGYIGILIVCTAIILAKIKITGSIL